MIKSFRLLATCMIGVASAASTTVYAQSTPEEASVRTALPYPTKTTPKAIDRGALVSRPDAAPVSATIALKLPKMEEAESLLKALHTPGDPQFGKFLTAEEFEARFAPSEVTVAKVITSMAKYGLSAKRTGTTTIAVSGAPASIERAFSVSLHNYEIPAQGRTPGYSYHAPLGAPTVPSEISASVAGVVGLDNRARLRPLHRFSPEKLTRAQQTKAPGAAGNEPGFWTVTDFANYYDVTPLYASGVTGRQRTIGILTFANFQKKDAFAYWSAIGLNVSPNRIHNIQVDGGPGVPSDASGSDETTLDVEQSGGVAPSAKVWVYAAPNTDQGFVDLFAAAIEANQAETLSISWGGWEWFDTADNSLITDPTSGQAIPAIAAVHQLLVRAAIQGQSVFASSGDAGAYEVNGRSCPAPECSLTLSVDYPASDPAITAAGGTTLSGVQKFCLDQACDLDYHVTIPHERVWSWDYLNGLCSAIGYDPLSCGIFPVGSGGGVSFTAPVPSYQAYLPGVKLTAINQYFAADGELYYALPANYAGRNVPDISFNADPDTGYILYYTSDQYGFGISSFGGGTSFVAPQLNGVTALLADSLKGKRLGLLNYPLYSLALTGQAYIGPNAPIHQILYGNNGYYKASNGYSPSGGLGTLDVANFAAALKKQY